MGGRERCSRFDSAKVPMSGTNERAKSFSNSHSHASLRNLSSALNPLLPLEPLSFLDLRREPLQLERLRRSFSTFSAPKR